MSSILVSENQENNVNRPDSTENSSTREFLTLERNCEEKKDSDDEIKRIFDEIHRLSNSLPLNKGDPVESESDDVELLLKKAEEISRQTSNLFKNSPSFVRLCESYPVIADNYSSSIPEITVTKPTPEKDSKNQPKVSQNKAAPPRKMSSVESSPVIKPKKKPRPYSAGIIDLKRRDSLKIASSSPPKKLPCKHDKLLEEYKDTAERAKVLEMQNAKLVEDNRLLKRKFNEINEEKQNLDLKLVECEKFIGKFKKDYEMKREEIERLQDSENKLKADLTKERNERKNLGIQHDKDKIVIQDLQRQCKEMEMILKRKHPDSVSALIVASKSSTVDENKKKLLEERISRLEKELQDKEQHFQSVLVTLHEKFTDMKQKYESHIIDVERQLMDDRKTNTELRNKLNKTNLKDSCVQTSVNNHTASTQTLQKSMERISSANRMTQNASLLFNKLKEDSYLIATIKGLQVELTTKQRTIARLNREMEEVRKNMRCMQKEREVLMQLNPQKRSINKPKSAENLLLRMNNEMESDLNDVRAERDALKQERDSLLGFLKQSNEEFIALKKKRLQDLHTLQVSHEKELMQMNMQIYPLQEEIQYLQRTVELLQSRLRSKPGLGSELGAGDSNARVMVKH